MFDPSGMFSRIAEYGAVGGVSSGVASVYHERQAAALCGVHCLNALVQAPLFTPGALADIAAELDAQERALMMEAGTETADAIRFAAQDSSNVDESGNFSVSVLSTALERRCGVKLDTSEAQVTKAVAEPTSFEGFILNLLDHWFTIRKVHSIWWNLNSLLPFPEQIGPVYLGAYLAQLRAEGYSIFIASGLPPLLSDQTAGERKNWHAVSALLDRSELKRTTARRRGSSSASRKENEEDAMARAIAASLGANDASRPRSTSGGYGDSDDDDDDDDEAAQLALALALSASAAAAPAPSPAAAAPAASSGAATSSAAFTSGYALGEDEDEAMARAIAMSQREAEAATAAADDADDGDVEVDLTGGITSSPGGYTAEEMRAALALSMGDDVTEGAAAREALDPSLVLGALQAALPSEPTGGPSARIAARLPSGVRCVRSFPRDASAAMLWVWVDAMLLQASGVVAPPAAAAAAPSPASAAAAASVASFGAFGGALASTVGRDVDMRAASGTGAPTESKGADEDAAHAGAVARLDVSPGEPTPGVASYKLEGPVVSSLERRTAEDLTFEAAGLCPSLSIRVVSE